MSKNQLSNMDNDQIDDLEKELLSIVEEVGEYDETQSSGQEDKQEEDNIEDEVTENEEVENVEPASVEIVEQISEPVFDNESAEDELIDNELIEDNILPLTNSPAGTDLINIKKLINDYDKDYDEVKHNLRSDRSQIEDVIGELQGVFQNGVVKIGLVEALVKALDVLANTNQSFVKLIDTKSKLMASLKSHASVVVNQNNVGGESSELRDILEQNIDDDDA